MLDQMHQPPAEMVARAYVDAEGYAACTRPRSPTRTPSGASRAADRLDQALYPGQEHFLRLPRRLDQVVRGRQAQRLGQLHRPPPRDPRRPDRDHLGERRPERRRAHHLPPAPRRGLEVRQRAADPRREEGRPRRALPADDPRRPPTPCSPAPASAPSTPSSSPASPPTRCARASRTPAPSSSITADEAPRGGRRTPLKANADKALAGLDGVRQLVVRRTGGDVALGPGRDIWLHEAMETVDGALRAGRDGRRGPALHPLHLRLDRQAQGRGAHHRRLSRLRRDDPPVRLRLPRRRHLLVHRRRRLGHRPQLHRLRPAGQRRDHADVRGRARPSPTPARFWAGLRQAQGQHLLHRPDRDPRPDGPGPRVGRQARPLEPAPPRLGRRADQPRGLELVRRGRRPGKLPDRRHLVADRDRRHPDHAAARRDPDQARLGDQALLRRAAGGARPATGAEITETEAEGVLAHRGQLARPDAHDLRRPRSASSTPTSASTRATTSPATAAAATPTATTGSPAASTT